MTMTAEGTVADVESVARRLGAWTATLEFAQIPPSVLRIAVRALLDTLGVAVAGAATAVAQRTRAHVVAEAASGPASLIGSAIRLAPAAAAVANGTAAHALDFDDSSYAGYVHGSAVVAPAVLAAAEAANASGAATLVAFVAGMEAEFAVGEATTRALYDRGWFTTALLGIIGAAAGAARILGLSPAQAAHAIALAAAQASGLRAVIGSDAKPYLAGRAAGGGVSAALLASGGISGPLHVFEERLGFAAVVNGGVFDAGAFTSLGRIWRMNTPGIDVKQYPTCLSSHAAADAAAELAAAHQIFFGTISEVICEVPPVVAVNLKHAHPTTPQEAQFSLPFALAAVLIFGNLGIEQVSDATLGDPRMRALMAKVATRVVERWNDDPARASYPEGAHVRLILRDGRCFERFNGVARGSASKPLADDGLDAKVLACLQGALAPEAARRLIAAIRSLADVRSVSDLLQDLRTELPAKPGR